MSIATIILGESGTGKSSAMRHMDPAETLLIQAIRKPLPFKAKGWGSLTKENPSGNVLVSDNSDSIMVFMRKTKRPIIVIDDWQYILSNEYMRRSAETGYQKFTDIGVHAWNLLTLANNLAEHQRVYILAHTQQADDGSVRIKTIGKMLDEKITPEGMFSIVLRTAVVNSNYLFRTQNSGNDTVKSPIGLFDTDLIPNDLDIVDKAICDFYQVTTTV